MAILKIDRVLSQSLLVIYILLKVKAISQEINYFNPVGQLLPCTGYTQPTPLSLVTAGAIHSLPTNTHIKSHSSHERMAFTSIATFPFIPATNDFWPTK